MEHLSKVRGESFDRTQKGQVAKQAAGALHFMTNIGKAIGAVKVLSSGLWLSTKAGISGLKNTAVVNQTNFAQRGGKIAFAGQVRSVLTLTTLIRWLLTIR